MDFFSLSGKVAIVTGGYTGLGKQIAEGLLEAGANVAVCARRLDKWTDSFEDLKRLAIRYDKRLVGSRCDVSVQSDIQEFVGRVIKELGSIDILVNAAGVAWAAPPEDMSLEDWDKVIGTNLTGTFLCSQIVGRVMIHHGDGRIINVGSIAGLYGSDPAVLDAIAYSASKAGIIGFTKDLALKWARYNIRVNALVPGWFRTHLTEKVLDVKGEKLLELIPLRRLGSEIDLKGAAVFLASEASSYVTGQVICVDGGLTAGR